MPGDFCSGRFGCAATAPCVRGVIMEDQKMLWSTESNRVCMHRETRELLGVLNIVSNLLLTLLYWCVPGEILFRLHLSFLDQTFYSGQITHFWLDVTVDSWRQNLLNLFWGLFYPKLEPDLKLIKEAYPFFNQLWVWQQSFDWITWNTAAVIFIYVVNKFVFFATHYKRNKHFSVFVNLTLNYWNNIFAIVFSTS